MSVKVSGNTSGNILEVDANNQLKVNLAANKTNAGYMAMASVPDEGSVTLSRLARQIDSSPDYRLRVGQDVLLFQEYFSGTDINTSIWGTPATNSTIAQASGFITLNNAASKTSGDGVILRCHTTFPVFSSFPLSTIFLAKIPNLSFDNAVLEWGAGIVGVAVGTPPTDGAFFRLTSAGLYCVVMSNDVEVSATLISAARLTAAGIVYTNTNNYAVIIDDDQATFWINDLLACRVARYATGGATSTGQQVVPFARQYNSAANTLTAQKISIAMISVVGQDADMGMPLSHKIASAGGMAIQKQTGVAAGRLSLFGADWTHLPDQLTAPAVTSYGGVSALGGRQRVGNAGNTVTLTADSAYLIFSYQVPALVVANPIVPAKNLIITGMQLSCSTRGAAGEAGIRTFLCSLFVGGNNVNPATAEAAGTPNKQARIVDLGQMSLITTAPVGSKFSPDIALNMSESPIVAYPSEFVQIAVTPMITHVIQANQELIFTWTVVGYWK